MHSPDATQDSVRRDAAVEGCRRMLMALSEKGMQLVRALDPEDETLSAAELALAYSRLARAVRLNIMLDLRLDALAEGGLAAERALAETAPEADVVEPAEPHSDAPERSDRDRPDREAPDEALRLIRRPMTEVVAAICRGYGLSPEATAQAQAPFAALTANDVGPDGPPASCRTTGVPPASAAAAARPPGALKARLMGGAARARALGP